MYFIAFYNGVTYLEGKIKRLFEELQNDGETLPEFITEKKNAFSK
jgi:hypothetical protein